MKIYLYLSRFVIIILLCCTSFVTFSQMDSSTHPTYFQPIDPGNFKPEIISEIILYKVNELRAQNDLDLLDIEKILTNAADDQARYMATIEEATLNNSGKKKTTSKRVIFYGGSKNAEEIVGRTNVIKGYDIFTYKQVVDAIVDKWISRRKSLELLNDPIFIFCGIGADIDEYGKRAYLSLVLGNHTSFNAGVEKRKELAVPYSKKKYGLKPYDYKACRRCDKFSNIEMLSSGLYEEDGKIYFEYDDLRALRKLIKGSKDGLAVDVVQKDQYKCEGPNIIDNNLISKGVMVKRVYSNKLYKKNLIGGKKPKEILVCLGKFPKKITGDYEMNLIIIKGKHVCKNLPQTFVKKGKAKYVSAVHLIPDTFTIKTDEYYVAKADTNLLNFRIPFQKSKFDYKPGDIKPFLESLNEPEFVIIDLSIAAYSSIEGTDAQNLKLQQKRAESIIAAMSQMQKSIIKTEIIKSDNWELFKKDVLDTEYDAMAYMTKEEAKEYIRMERLQTKLEPILANHRFAEINMEVTYDIEGEKEQYFVVSKFNKTLKKGDLKLAMGIQKYIIKKVLAKEYKPVAVKSQKIPSEKKFQPFLINMVFLEEFISESGLNEENCSKVDEIYHLDSLNRFIIFDKVCCDVLHKDFVDINEMKKMQRTIDALYKKDLNEVAINNLNIEFQFKSLKAFDTLDTSGKLKLEAIERIKEITNIKEGIWQNALVLCNLFIEHDEHEFATQLLDPFVYEDDISEDFVFTYISLCTRSLVRQISKKFVAATSKASTMNKSKFCGLFNGSKFSFQTFDNPDVKKNYCKVCLGK